MTDGAGAARPTAGAATPGPEHREARRAPAAAGGERDPDRRAGRGAARDPRPRAARALSDPRAHRRTAKGVAPNPQTAGQASGVRTAGLWASGHSRRRGAGIAAEPRDPAPACRTGLAHTPPGAGRACGHPRLPRRQQDRATPPRHPEMHVVPDGGYESRRAPAAPERQRRTPAPAAGPAQPAKPRTDRGTCQARQARPDEPRPRREAPGCEAAHDSSRGRPRHGARGNRDHEPPHVSLAG